MYAVLKFNLTRTTLKKDSGEFYYAATAEKIGNASGMQDAKRLSRAPVLSSDPRWVNAAIGTQPE